MKLVDKNDTTNKRNKDRIKLVNKDELQSIVLVNKDEQDIDAPEQVTTNIENNKEKEK